MPFFYKDIVLQFCRLEKSTGPSLVLYFDWNVFMKKFLLIIAFFILEVALPWQASPLVHSEQPLNAHYGGLLARVNLLRSQGVPPQEIVRIFREALLMQDDCMDVAYFELSEEQLEKMRNVVAGAILCIMAGVIVYLILDSAQQSSSTQQQSLPETQNRETCHAEHLNSSSSVIQNASNSAEQVRENRQQLELARVAAERDFDDQLLEIPLTQDFEAVFPELYERHRAAEARRVEERRQQEARQQAYREQQEEFAMIAEAVANAQRARGTSGRG
jgi:hypothetical protein